MKRFSIYTIAVASIFCGLTANAQKKDSLLNRQVSIERDYTPTLQEASRINAVPYVYEPTLQRTDVRFVQEPPKLGLKDNLLGKVASGDINNEIEFTKKRGYLILGAGNYANIDAAAGYRLVQTTKSRLDFFGSHFSTSGDLEYLQKGYAFDKMKAKFQNSKIYLGYKHMLKYADFAVDASYNHLEFNYYGNSFLQAPTASMYDYSSKQRVSIFRFGTQLSSNDRYDGFLSYKGSADYRYFNNRYGITTSDKGNRGGVLDLNLDLFKNIDNEKLLGVRGNLLNEYYIKPQEYVGSAFEAFTNITASPYIKFYGGNWHTELGANIHTLFDVKNKLAFSPHIKLWFDVGSKTVLYGNLTGCINNNTYLNILQENRYVNLLTKVNYSRDAYDAKVGIKSGVISGFEFSFFGGYKQTNGDYLYAFTQLPSIQSSWANTSAPIYADISTGHIGGEVKTSLIPRTDLTLKVIGYDYKVKYVDNYIPIYKLSANMPKKAFGRPLLTLNLRADVKPIDNLVLSANYILSTGRRAYVDNPGKPANSLVGNPEILYFDGTYRSMKDVNELSLKAEYRFTDWVSFYFRANNVLFQKYELVDGYPVQDFNIMAGAIVKF